MEDRKDYLREMFIDDVKGYLKRGCHGGGSNNDSFWDMYQNGGDRADYKYAFAGSGWTDELFKPKYDIKPTDARYMFTVSSITDLKNIGVEFDLSSTSEASQLMAYSKIETVGVLDCTNMSYLSTVFYEAKALKSVDKIILKDDGSQGFTSAQNFADCSELTHCIFEGCIGQNGFNIQWSTKLDKESLLSILNCLKDYSKDTSHWTVTIGSENMAKLTANELNIAYKKGWTVN
jgi:hypothetical protein